MISRVSNQNGVSLLYIMLKIHQYGREPSIYTRDAPFWSGTLDIEVPTGFLNVAGPPQWPSVRGFAHKRHVCRQCVARLWEGEMCHTSRACMLEMHARQHISSVCSTFPCRKMTHANTCMLCQSDFYPFACQGSCRL